MAPAVLDIAIGSDKSTVTPEHEFWVIGEGWKQAKELWVGAKLLTKDSQEVRVEWIGKRTGEFRVYNFSVTGTATYFVGKTGVLVHNACNPITMDDAVEKAAQHVGGQGKVVVSGSGGYQFVNSTVDAQGRTITNIGRLDINPASSHVNPPGGTYNPHLNLDDDDGL